MKSRLMGDYISQIKESLLNYRFWLNNGMNAEDARFVLPSAIKTTLIMTSNLQGWYDFIKLRATEQAQWEIRSIAYEIGKILLNETVFFNGLEAAVNTAVQL
jgi:thymidylate synthase (FAD)